jgi:hypothetical protein
LINGCGDGGCSIILLKHGHWIERRNCEETAKNVDFKLQLLEPIEVKGKAKPLQVYTWA